VIIQTNERKKEANVLLKAKNVHTLEINEYRALTRYCYRGFKPTKIQHLFAIFSLYLKNGNVG